MKTILIAAILAASLAAPVLGDQPTKAQPQNAFLQQTITSMKVGPVPPGVTEGMVRVSGVVTSVAEDGAFLGKVAAVRWVKESVSRGGKIVTTIGPAAGSGGGSGGLFVLGKNFSLGQMLTLDGRMQGSRRITIDGKGTTVPTFQAVGAKPKAGAASK